MQNSSAIRINDPIEYDRQEEERYEVEDFVVDISAELNR